MKLLEFVERKNYLTEEDKKGMLLEGVKYFRLSLKVEKLIAKLKEKHFKLPDEEQNQAERIIKTLKEDILPAVKKIERDYDKGNINWKQAAYKLKKLKVKMAEIIKFLKREHIFSSVEWEKYVYVLTSLMWIPSAVIASKDIFAPSS